MGKSSIVRPLILIIFVIGISLLHYLTPLHLPYLHDIFQRLYYLPIILAALWYGFRGGLLCSGRRRSGSYGWPGGRAARPSRFGTVPNLAILAAAIWCSLPDRRPAGLAAGAHS